MSLNHPFEIILPGEPLPWKAPYVGSRGAYSVRTPVMNQLKLLVRSQYRGPCFTGALEVALALYFKIPKATSKKKRELMIAGKIRPIKRPDRTNVAKFQEDILQGIVYEDDAQIVCGNISKWYAENPRTVILISSVENES